MRDGLRIQIVTEHGDILADEIVDLDDVDEVADRHAQITMGANRQGIKTKVVVTDPGNDLSPRDIAAAMTELGDMGQFPDEPAT